MSLRAKTARGVAWSGLGQGGRWILGLVLTVILARLLTPSQFGLLGMVMVFLGLGGLLRTLGLGTAVIQQKDLTEGQLSAVFLINLAAGGVLAAFSGSNASLRFNFMAIVLRSH